MFKHFYTGRTDSPTPDVDKLDDQAADADDSIEHVTDTQNRLSTPLNQDGTCQANLYTSMSSGHETESITLGKQSRMSRTLANISMQNNKTVQLPIK